MKLNSVNRIILQLQCRMRFAEYAQVRVLADKEKISPDEMKEAALQMKNGRGAFEFEKALRKEKMSFICECKKASPSKGLIEPDFQYLKIAKEYELAGADCISVLTEPKWFLGSGEYLKEIANRVSVPCLRKDFTVDEYQIYQAKVLGASAVLLICSILSEEQISTYLGICEELGLSALVETHDEDEVKMALRAGVRLIGVNNRNLKDFSVDTDNSRRLRELIPSSVLFVSESGVKTAEDVAKLQEIGADAVLIGETLMRADDKKARVLSRHPIIKAFRIESAGDIANVECSSADYVLLDSGAGSGESFEWNWIKDMKRPFFLAGGLNIQNVATAVSRLHPFAVDVSSGIETNGIKDQAKMAAFVAAVRKEDRNDK